MVMRIEFLGFVSVVMAEVDRFPYFVISILDNLPRFIGDKTGEGIAISF
jgi:hypothetical protein